MTPSTGTDLNWLLDDLVGRIKETEHAIVLSSDGLLMASSAGLQRTDGEHLSAVAGGHHARRLMHVEADVLAVDRSRLARVQADPHQNFVLVGPGVLRKRLLGLGGGERRFSGGGERDEERVTLAVDHEAVVLFACLPEQTVVLSEQVGVGV